MLHCRVSEDTFKKCLGLARIMNEKGITISDTKHNPTSHEEFQLLRKLTQSDIFEEEFYSGEVFRNAIKNMNVTQIVNELSAATSSQSAIIQALEEYGSMGQYNAAIKVMGDRKVHMIENVRDKHKESYRKFSEFQIAFRILNTVFL